jgi:hypothetical protein
LVSHATVVTVVVVPPRLPLLVVVVMVQLLVVAYVVALSYGAPGTVSSMLPELSRMISTLGWRSEGTPP